MLAATDLAKVLGFNLVAPGDELLRCWGRVIPDHYDGGVLTDSLRDATLGPTQSRLRMFKEGRVKAYCMKCRAQREIKNPKSIVMKNKRPATQGVCPVCGTKVFRIGKG